MGPVIVMHTCIFYFLQSLLAAVKEGNMAEVQSLLKDPLTRTIINDQDWVKIKYTMHVL